jgi:urease accessory protein
MTFLRRSSLIVLLVIFCQSPALAHPGHDVPGSGAVAGLLHPILGLDHLLAMLTVGLLSAQLGGRAIWVVPGSFITCMIVGGLAGMAKWDLPAIELGIAGSIIVLGLAVAVDRRFPLAIPMACAGLFGFLHGHAHGTEMPGINSPMLYALGFIVATAGLHLAGVLIGQSVRKSTRGTIGLRFSGVAIALSGCWFLLPV